MSEANVLMIPHPGQLVVVRNRPAIVRDIKKFVSPQRDTVHSIYLDYIDGFTHPESDFVIWERELNPRVVKGITLPKVYEASSIDSPNYFHAFINCYRWSSVNDIDELSSISTNKIKLISPWQSAIQIEDYQLYPLLQIFSMPRITLLLSDDVGLGKTIEAGLILNELIARGRLRRILVICPAALQIQWRDEMREKFYLDFEIVDRENTYQFQKEFGVDSNPWSSFPRIITSLDYIRQRDVLQNFLAATNTFMADNDSMLPWDMLLVDEAHNISSRYYGEDTERLRMIRQINPYFENRLFLTATPHNGYTESFSGLLELLNPLVFEQKRVLEENDITFIHEYVIRRLKSDFIKDGMLQKFTKREIHRIDKDYNPLSIEAELFKALKAYKKKAKEIAYEESGSKKFIVSFLLTLLTKRLLSSVYAFAKTWWNHFSGINYEEIEDSDVEYAIKRAQSDIVDDNEKDLREEEVSRKIGSWLSRNSDQLQEEINVINNILNSIGWGADIIEKDIEDIKSFPEDSKWNSLRKWINSKLKDGNKFKADERVIIFTEYKHTLDYLLQRFKEIEIAAPKIETLYGGSPQAQRENIKTYFTDAESPLKILLVTDVASEGINLQNNCRYVVHYEIPWNPMRLEQRNGRVDRFGQSRDVHVYHFISDEEDDLKFLERVVHKVEKIREDLGSVGEIFDKSLEDYFLGNAEDKIKALGYIEYIQPEIIENKDLSSSSKGSKDDYHKAFQRLKASEIDLELSPANLAEVLRISFDLENGKLVQHPNEEGVYQIEIIPPRWKKLIESNLKIPSGPQAGALYKLVFDSSYFEKVENGRLLYLNKPDAQLIRIGHPLMKRAIGLLKKKLWEIGDYQSQRGLLNRYTLQKSKLPDGIDNVLVGYILIEANNELRETIHEEVISLPYIIKGKSLEEIDSYLWGQIKSIERKFLTPVQLNQWLPKDQE